MEDFNYAIAEAAEPGSTFKLASCWWQFEDQLVDLRIRSKSAMVFMFIPVRTGPCVMRMPRRSRMSVQRSSNIHPTSAFPRIIFPTMPSDRRSL